jgi:hypothetical protein
MQIVINHLTRMKPPHICVAGLTLEQRPVAVRPVGPRITRQALASLGGAYRLGALVDLGPTQRVGTPPECEDHEPYGVPRTLRQLTAEEFWQTLSAASEPTLAAIFGPSLRARGRTFAVDAGLGHASLGVWRPQGSIEVQFDPYGKIRLTTRVAGQPLNLPVTDLTLHDPDGQPDSYRVTQLQRSLGRSSQVLLSVGLTRLWRAADDTQDRHWLQVNNIHPESSPLEPWGD